MDSDDPQGLRGVSVGVLVWCGTGVISLLAPFRLAGMLNAQCLGPQGDFGGWADVPEGTTPSVCQLVRWLAFSWDGFPTKLGQCSEQSGIGRVCWQHGE